MDFVDKTDADELASLKAIRKYIHKGMFSHPKEFESKRSIHGATGARCFNVIALMMDGLDLARVG